ncbi:uncharacterized protein CDAR_607761 [Caerostris darwini]|uniref:Paralemmin n=1 Tax=Caerostris darwini TaxID=1538125 RepID=A0AAV4UM62_9ARAC|nr:uncharacterized protein CDAR_607761 [Caerostris darwini]
MASRHVCSSIVRASRDDTMCAAGWIKDSGRWCRRRHNPGMSRRPRGRPTATVALLVEGKFLISPTPTRISLREYIISLMRMTKSAPMANNGGEGEESRVHPAKVRVKFIESQHVAQVTCAPPSPDVTLDFISDTMTSPTSEHSPDYHRQISHESGVDNPFRPDGELSREADTIVSLIKEGKPITPVKGEDMDVVANGFQHDQTDTAAPNGHQVTEAVVTPQSNAPLQSAKPKGGANGTTPKDATATPGIVEVQRGVIVPPTDAPAVEQVIIKKKPKCKCCVIQ